MFNKFESCFRRGKVLEQLKDDSVLDHLNDPNLKELFFRFGGSSFNGGLYRIMSADTFALGSAFVTNAFSEFAARITVFSYDWLGRIFALDSGRLESGLPAVVMFEPGARQALEIPCNLLTFHENELIDFEEAALATSFFKKWLAYGGNAPAINECVGYRKLLFLGGKDIVENLEISDLDVYWTISAQIIQQTRAVLPGTPIRKVEKDGNAL